MRSFPSHELASSQRKKLANDVVITTDRVSTIEFCYCNQRNWKYVDRC